MTTTTCLTMAYSFHESAEFRPATIGAFMCAAVPRALGSMPSVLYRTDLSPPLLRLEWGTA
jgi:hypothetical protein